jgi:hypothetical protein
MRALCASGSYYNLVGRQSAACGPCAPISEQTPRTFVGAGRSLFGRRELCGVVSTSARPTAAKPSVTTCGQSTPDGHTDAEIALPQAPAALRHRSGGIPHGGGSGASTTKPSRNPSTGPPPSSVATAAGITPVSYPSVGRR